MDWVQGSLFDDIDEDDEVEIGCADYHDPDFTECYEYRASYESELLRMPDSRSRAFQTYNFGG